jgi:hypothetical protein
MYSNIKIQQTGSDKKRKRLIKQTNTSQPKIHFLKLPRPNKVNQKHISP